jgi:predicted transcriptional regulator
MPTDNTLISLTTQLVAAHVSHNTVEAAQLPDLIQRVHNILNGLSRGETIAPPTNVQPPAVAIKASVKPDAITCLDCGKQFKMLKRHLTADHKTTPEQYRLKWSLPVDYPMVAPTYAKTRSTLAKEIGLGTWRGPRTARKQRRRA